MVLAYFLLCCLISLIQRTNENICEDSFHQSFVKNGRFIDGETVWESITKDVVECAQSCLRLTKCRAFNFDQADGMCQLRSAVGTKVLRKKNSVHSDIASWPSQIDPDCYHKPCGEDEVCIPGTLARGSSCSYTCLKLGRKCPILEGALSSQPRTVGSVYTHTCGRGTVGGDSVLCLPTGEWNKTLDTTCTQIFGMQCEADLECAPINGRCDNNVCRCETGSGYDKGSSTCVKGRKCPIPEGTPSSQPRTVGSVYTHTCGRGTVGGDSVLCLPTGEWNKTLDTTCTQIFGMQCEADLECAPINAHCDNNVCRCETGSGYDNRSSTCVKDYWNDLYEFTFGEEERWKTSNASLTFTDWGSTEPDNDKANVFTIERCTVFDSKQSYKWTDTMCGATGAAVLCQRNVTQLE